jgi:hypothetical protein
MTTRQTTVQANARSLIHPAHATALVLEIPAWCEEITDLAEAFYVQEQKRAKGNLHLIQIYTASCTLHTSGSAAFVFVQTTFARLSILPLANNSSTCKLASNILVMKFLTSIAVNESRG